MNKEYFERQVAEESYARFKEIEPLLVDCKITDFIADLIERIVRLELTVEEQNRRLNSIEQDVQELFNKFPGPLK